jgi:hypothetical protein
VRKTLLRFLVVPFAASAVFLSLAGGSAFGQHIQGPKQDMKDAGRSSKRAAKDTGRAAKKTTKKGIHKSAKKVNKGSKKVERKTEPQP